MPSCILQNIADLTVRINLNFNLALAFFFDDFGKFQHAFVQIAAADERSAEAQGEICSDAKIGCAKAREHKDNFEDGRHCAAAFKFFQRCGYSTRNVG